MTQFEILDEGEGESDGLGSVNLEELHDLSSSAIGIEMRGAEGRTMFPRG